MISIPEIRSWAIRPADDAYQYSRNSQSSTATPPEAGDLPLRITDPAPIGETFCYAGTSLGYGADGRA